ncbi:type II toxin-antitoxin system VapC family toxin [Prosthecobacter fusiformis]|uniref:type II toxin-antitoxin system VapC family toxin n=1 Tax=Prosthecobacter fusiformis TaxID=48464 RepID=UPI00105C745E|nr:type II toxin-antitoxin system VapC family toxin [Prosthecobacter fusiformis]
MILLDSNHLAVLKYREHPRCLSLSKRLKEHADEGIGTTVIAFEEQMRGWLGLIARTSQISRQVSAYHELAGISRFFARWNVVDFDDLAASRFESLRGQKLRVGSMDLKMASIALVNNALLLTANKRDFIQVPNLRFENWLE